MTIKRYFSKYHPYNHGLTYEYNNIPNIFNIIIYQTKSIFYEIYCNFFI